MRRKKVTEPEVELEVQPEVESETELEVQPEVEPEAELEVQPEEIVKTILEGSLNGCSKLNMRKEASKDSEIVYVLSKDSVFTICLEESTEDFYKVYTSNEEILVEGYCLKEFINVK